MCGHLVSTNKHLKRIIKFSQSLFCLIVLASYLMFCSYCFIKGEEKINCKKVTVITMKTRYVYSASTNSSRRIFSQCIVILVIIVSYLLFWLSLSDFLSLIVCFKHLKGSKERYVFIRKKQNKTKRHILLCN